MATFTKLYTARIIKDSNTNELVTIVKVQKDGTNRTFFRPTVLIDGVDKSISKTLWLRLYDAETVSRNYLNRNK